MKDYTEIFSKAIELSSGYDVKKIAVIINAIGDNYCGESGEWGHENWYILDNPEKIYGYLSVDYPVALIKENCPDIIKSVLTENNILFTEFEQPMRCKEDILQKYVENLVADDYVLFNDSEFPFADERFRPIFEMLTTDVHHHINADNFMFYDIYMS